MSGPVWRFEKDASGRCCVCLTTVTGVFVEGEVVAGSLRPGRAVCPACFDRARALLVSGEVGGRAAAPAYASPTGATRQP